MPVRLSVNNAVAVLQIDNPGNLNALSTAVMTDISSKLKDIELSARVLIITGLSRAFAAGVDINEIASLSFEEAVQSDFINDQWEALRNVKIPVIAAVSGYVLGGGFELALMADIIVSAKSAKFGFPEINLGLMPGLGGTQMLTELVGPKIATKMIMSGEFISADRAYQLRIVSEITEDDKLMESAYSMAQQLVEKSGTSLRMAKIAIRLAQGRGLVERTQVERQLFRALFDTKEKQQRVTDFLKKRR